MKSWRKIILAADMWLLPLERVTFSDTEIYVC